MQILFLHDNFPAQFGVFGQYLAKKGWDVWFGTQRKGVKLDGLKTFSYAPHRDVTEKIHPYIRGLERAVLNGQGCARAAIKLKQQGLSPDIVMAHSGWGPGLFVKDVWPKSKYVGYFEWYYNANAPDVLFLNEKQRDIDDDLRTRMRNASIQMDLITCDAALCPTIFQRDQFPADLARKLTVMHDGIDTDTYKSSQGAKLVLDGVDLSAVDEVITYVARGMEPYRGYPEFMRALEKVQQERPEAHAVIVGEDRVAYGKKLPEGDSFKKRALDECSLDMNRVHFTGLLSRGDYLKVLQASSVHVYLTVPFVLSWSMMEAMSAECAIVTSAVSPIEEVAGNKVATVKRVDHRSVDELSSAIVSLLKNRQEATELGAAARQFILDGYSMRKLFPAKEGWLKSLVTDTRPV